MKDYSVTVTLIYDVKADSPEEAKKKITDHDFTIEGTDGVEVDSDYDVEECDDED